MRAAGGLAAVVMALGLGAGGCAAKPSPIRDPEPELVRITSAFEATVEAAHEHPSEEWHSGWTGNMWINMRQGPARGLCHEWQWAVYEGVRGTVEDVGWEAVGVSVDAGLATEHHAVVVFDPRRTRAEVLLDEPTPPAFVLDGWRRGKPDVYTLEEWIRTNWPTPKTLAIEDLEAEAEMRARAASESVDEPGATNAGTDPSPNELPRSNRWQTGRPGGEP